MTKTTTLIHCLYNIAPDYPKAPLAECADRMSLLKAQLEQCLPLVKHAAHDPCLEPSINFACMKLAKQIEECLE